MGRLEYDCSRIFYHKAHIKGAIFLDLETLKDMKSDLPYMLPTPKEFADRMKRLGVRMSDQVVCYDSGTMQFFGYRAAWMFKAMGHKNVSVLDGGFPKWVKDGLPVESCDRDFKDDDFGYKL